MVQAAIQVKFILILISLNHKQNSHGLTINKDINGCGNVRIFQFNDGYDNSGWSVEWFDDAESHAFISTPMERDIWYNVTLAFDGDTLKSYLNGIYESSFLYPNRQLHNYLQIGGRAYLIGDQYNGYIDDIIIYNRYLDEDEVFELYDKTRELVYGCNHPNALNYDIHVDIDDGSCQFETVQIGHQVWMTENLKATHYSNGDAIQTGLDNEAWTSTEEGAYTVYDDDPANAEVYGNLYNWYAAYDDRGVCPEGWHVPLDEEFDSLFDFLGGLEISGGKIKECTQGDCPDSDYWIPPNTGATNEVGFDALPTGWRHSNVGLDYEYKGELTAFWSSEESPENTNNSTQFMIWNTSNEVVKWGQGKKFGIPIRCLSDELLNTTIHVPGDFPTIQAAIDYSIDGDSILVAAGTYYENINFNGKSISVIGEDRETTIIDGSQNGSVVVFDSEETISSILRGFTIQNGHANGIDNYSFGGGILVINSSPYLEDLIVQNNFADYGVEVLIFMVQSKVY